MSIFSCFFPRTPEPKPEPLAVVTLTREQTHQVAKLIDAYNAAPNHCDKADRFALWSYIEDITGYGAGYSMTIDHSTALRFSVIVRHRVDEAGKETK